MSERDFQPGVLRTIRIQRDLLLKQVSDTTGIPLKSLSNYERGYATPPCPRLAMLAGFYHVPIDTFFGGEGCHEAETARRAAQELRAETRRLKQMAKRTRKVSARIRQEAEKLLEEWADTTLPLLLLTTLPWLG